MNGKVLIVDDDPTHLLIAQEILSDEGHQVAVHRGAFGTMQKVFKERPDVVLLDVNMPGLSGEGVCALLEQWRAEQGTAILFYSSNDEGSLRKTSERYRTAGFVTKGDPDQLRTTVRRVLTQKRRQER